MPSHKHKVSFTVTCTGLHHLLLMYITRPPLFFFLQSFVSLSDHIILNPDMCALSIEILLVSHVSVKHKRLHFLYSFWFLNRAGHSSALFIGEFKFPITTNRTEDLYLHFFSLCLAFTDFPARHPRYSQSSLGLVSVGTLQTSTRLTAN